MTRRYLTASLGRWEKKRDTAFRRWEWNHTHRPKKHPMRKLRWQQYIRAVRMVRQRELQLERLSKPTDHLTFDGHRVSRRMHEILTCARKRGWRGSLNSGLRTYTEQARLYALFRAGRGAPAFPPWGPSKHLTTNMPASGVHAVDVQDPVGLLIAAKKCGVFLVRPYGNEPWHCEVA